MAENPRIEELRRRVQADPASIAFAALAEEFRRVGRYDEAVETCRTGLQRHPAYLSARVTLGRALIETGDFDGAREELETVLRTAPENLAAIRGLAQIQEQLGHSAEMDPHLADMMKTMHVESLRVAALKPPEPAPEPPEPLDEAPGGSELPLSLATEATPALSLAPEPELSFTPESEPGPELSLAPEPVAPVETLTDPFAGFSPMAKPSAAPDFSFDLGAPMMSEPPRDLAADAPFAGAQGRHGDAAPDTSLDLSMDPPVELFTEGFEDAGSDPAVLATLVRLERFLGAIQSLRA
jgi:tetratricopeptide (TPR) repeat protein